MCLSLTDARGMAKIGKLSEFARMFFIEIELTRGNFFLLAIMASFLMNIAKGK